MRRVPFKQPETNCSSCPLGKTGRCYIQTDTVTDSPPGTIPRVDILFVTDYPNFEEDSRRLPMMGEGGRAVRTHIEEMGGGLRYAFAHLIRCRTKTGHTWRPPEQREIEFCADHVRKDIEVLKPRVVVLMGALTLVALNPDPSDTAWASGAVMEVRRRGPKVINGVTWVCAPSPSMILTKPAQRGLILGDVQRAMNLARGTSDEFSSLGKSVLITTIPEFLELKEHIIHGLTENDSVALDTETLNLHRVATNKVLTWQFAWDFHTGYVVPYEHNETPWTPEQIEKVIKPGLQEIFTSKEARFLDWVMHNGPFDVDKAQRYLGIYKLNKPIFDTQFGAYTLDENRVGFDTGQKSGKKGIKGFGPMSLKTLAPEFLGFYHYNNEAETIEHREAGLLALLPLVRLAEYAGMDGYVTLRLRARILEMAAQYAPSLYRFTTRWFGRAIPMSPCIERAGICVDTKQLAVLRSDDSPILKRIDEVVDQLYGMDETKKANEAIRNQDGRTAGMVPLFGEAPWMFNVNKKQHLCELFLNQLGLEPLEFGKPDKNYPDYPDGAPSIDRMFFDAYKEDNPSVKLVHEYKGLEKLRTSYMESIQDFLNTHPDMSDGRVRASLLWTRTVTNRVSQKDPNNSQLPRADNDYKKAIKALYRAAPGHVLMEADYSQAEIRWWAQLAGDTAYAKTFQQMLALRALLAQDPRNKELAARVAIECDVHRQTAAIMYRKPIAEITKEERQGVKSLVFGAIYGQHIATLAQLLKISLKMAESLQEAFFNQVPRAAKWLTQIEQFALRNGYVEDAFKRRRHLRQELDSPDKGVASRALRQARNSPVQGSSSNMMILAAANVHDRIVTEKRPVKLINLVHDAMLVEVPMDLATIKDTAHMLRTEMTNTDHLVKDWGIPMMIPFEVDFKVGLSWGFAYGIDVTPGNTFDDIYARIEEEYRAERHAA